MKHYIYVSRCKGEDISLNCFCRVLKHYKSLEYEAAVTKDKVSMHMRKWQNIESVIGGSSELPMWLTDGFSVTFFGRWWGLCAYTRVTYSYRTR